MTSDDVRAAAERLVDFHERFAPLFGKDQAQDHERCLRVPEAGDRPAPVGLLRVRRALLARDLLTPRDEPRAPPARDHLALERGECRRQRAEVRAGRIGHAASVRGSLVRVY